MGELGKAFNALFSKIGDFFDIFDLSFVISGAALVGSGYMWLTLSNVSIPFDLSSKSNILAIIIICYISGLICFALGRFLRKEIINRIVKLFSKKNKNITEKYSHFLDALEAHNLSQDAGFSSYLKEGKEQPSRLYIRLWAEIRQTPELAPSFSLLKRYWVMAATYDGLASVSLLWIYLAIDATFGITLTSLQLHWYGLPLILISLLTFFVCSREAERYVKNQVEEIVGTIATVRG